MSRPARCENDHPWDLEEIVRSIPEPERAVVLREYPYPCAVSWSVATTRPIRSAAVSGSRSAVWLVGALMSATKIVTCFWPHR